MPQMAGDHRCGVKSSVEMVKPSQQQPEQVETGLCVQPAAGSQVCAFRSGSSRPTAVLREIREGTSGIRRLCSSSVMVCSSHALPPQWLLHCSASLLKSLSSAHIHRSTTTPPPLTLSPARLLFHAHCSLHAQPLIINMIPCSWSETHLQMN